VVLAMDLRGGILEVEALPEHALEVDGVRSELMRTTVNELSASSPRAPPELLRPGRGRHVSVSPGSVPA